jgi:arabinose-5-phosphate isomerase
MPESESQKIVRQVLEIEARSVLELIPRLSNAIDNAIDLLAGCRGRVIAVGIGKMGCIARKAAATLASTGTPAVFLQASDALHGDLGIVTSSDVVLILSNSGQTDEILKLLPYLKRSSVDNCVDRKPQQFASSQFGRRRRGRPRKRIDCPRRQ